MKKTIISEDELLKLKQLQETKNNESLKRFILEQTESLVKDRFSDKELDAENVKRSISLLLYLRFQVLDALYSFR